MSFSPKPGCPMCGIVASGVHTPSHSPRSPQFPAGSTAPHVLWRDENFTIYRELANPVSSKGHVIIVFNLHVPSLYSLSSSDLPLLVTIRDLSSRLLASLLPESSSDFTPASPSTSTTPSHLLPTHAPLELPETSVDHESFRIGFITPPFRDSKIPVTDHLHAHAYILPADLMGWWRGVGYGSLAWYAIDDLIAEIREETSNNRVRSGPQKARGPRPIDLVPSAGARQGTADGTETTETGLSVADPEDPERSPGVRPLSMRAASSSSRSTTPTRSATLGPLTVPYTGAGGALLMSPTDGRSTPVRSRSTPTRSSTATDAVLLSPIRLNSSNA